MKNAAPLIVPDFHQEEEEIIKTAVVEEMGELDSDDDDD